MPYDPTLRKLWVAAGYRRDMGSAAASGPPPPDMIRLYHLSTSEHAVSNIENRRLKVTRIRDLNDPFELMALNLREGEFRRVVKDFRATFDSQTGLLCFSEDWTSPVMWSHYASQHRGICLGFNVRRTTVHKVEYKDRRLRAELDDTVTVPTLTEEQKAMLMRTKCHEWKYEREHRRFILLDESILDNGLHFCSLDNDIHLAEVVLGAHCPEQVSKLRYITEELYTDVRVFRARLAWKHFKVVPKESSVP